MGKREKQDAAAEKAQNVVQTRQRNAQSRKKAGRNPLSASSELQFANELEQHIPVVFSNSSSSGEEITKVPGDDHGANQSSGSPGVPSCSIEPMFSEAPPYVTQ
ncbi:hypothetical protein FGB62_161g05 [Gracilaria domingensis]|nr:hypothetical protein FGB62_161g05 [Gracilaria domingensis]